MFKCECGKEFEKAQSFNAHKASCKEHYLAKYGNLDYWNELQSRRGKHISKTLSENATKDREQKLALWISEKHVCKVCGKVMTKKYGKGIYCSSSCTHKYASSKVDYDNVKKAQQKYLSNLLEQKEQEYLQHPNFCCICNKILPYSIKNRRTCSDDCYKILNTETGHLAGLASAKARSEVARSKNEIYFCELCEQHFKTVKHNEPIFNGWDADVIIEDIKYAILWNGPWHYRKITEKRSVAQVQNRDKIKIHEIEQAGYIPYIIKDDGKYNPQFVEEQFKIFIDSLS